MSRATDALDVLFAAEALDAIKTLVLTDEEIAECCVAVAGAWTSGDRAKAVLAKLAELQAAGG